MYIKSVSILEASNLAMHFIAAELSYFYLATAIFYITLTTKATSLLTSKTESQVKFETACLPKNCKLPDCFCSGTKIPGNLSPQVSSAY